MTPNGGTPGCVLRRAGSPKIRLIERDSGRRSSCRSAAVALTAISNTQIAGAIIRRLHRSERKITLLVRLTINSIWSISPAWVSFIVPLNFRPGIDAERSSESGTRLLFCNSTVSGHGCRDVSAGGRWVALPPLSDATEI
jgi:hypothetical protein